MRSRIFLRFYTQIRLGYTLMRHGYMRVRHDYTQRDAESQINSETRLADSVMYD